MKTVGVILMTLSIFSLFHSIPEAVLHNEEGFVDLDLNVSKFTTKDSATIITVSNNYKGKSIGFQLEIYSDWKLKEIEKTNQYLYWGTGKFINTGENTNNFIVELALLYKAKLGTIVQKEIPVKIVGLANDPRLMKSENTKMKVFFNSDSGNEALYSEVFINLDLKNNRLQFNEKDQGYRQPLINSLVNGRGHSLQKSPGT